MFIGIKNNNMNLKNGVLFVLIALAVKSTNAQFIAVAHYENKAQAYAILSAQFSKEAYFFTKRIDVATNYALIKNLADTGYVFTQLALEYADSAFAVASEDAKNALKIMHRAKGYQQKANYLYAELKAIKKEAKKNNLIESLLYALGNAVDDAYLASLLFENTTDTSENTLVETKPRNVSRLETDELSFMTLKEVFGTRIVEIEDELLALENKAKNVEDEELNAVLNAIEQLKKEKISVTETMKNSNDKLVSIKSELSEEMLKVVDAAIFSTTKKGFYSEQVPIPLNANFPKGLVYKIQVGFFQNQLPQAHFDGIFPLASEQVDAVYFRYMAGNFPTYSDAKQALKSTNEKGYTDAFIIAYLNGKKISISEALGKEATNN